MQLPEINLPPDAMPWARAMMQRDAERAQEIAALEAQLARLYSGDGSQSKDTAQLFYELRFLYNVTGNPYPPVQAAPPAGTPENPIPSTPQYRTGLYDAAWSRTWGSSSYYTGGGEYTDAQMLYQGSNPENKVGMFHFGGMEEFAGKYVTAASLWLQNQNSPWGYYFTAHLGTHSLTAPPVSKPSRWNPFDVGWTRGEGKWIALPGWALGGLSDGSIKGFTVGASGASDADSAYFQGVGKASPPRLSVTYQIN